MFSKFAGKISKMSGTPMTFGLACLIIIIWAFSGPIFRFSDTWQLVINTSTTIVTFLMVFLIQNTQNRDSQVMQLKLDELVRALDGARNDLLDLENAPAAEIEKKRMEFAELARKQSECGVVDKSGDYSLAQAEARKRARSNRNRKAAKDERVAVKKKAARALLKNGTSGRQSNVASKRPDGVNRRQLLSSTKNTFRLKEAG